MLNILYVYAHPNPTSFNAMLKQSGCALLKKLNADVMVSDLYADNFRAVASWDDFNLSQEEANPQYFVSQQIAYKKHVLADDIQTEMEKITWANHIIFQFPLWWFSTPAILKGWFDRVLVKGFSYDAGKMFNEGLLKGKQASLVVTTQSPETAFQVNGVHGVTIDVFLKPIQHTLRLVGIKPVLPFVAYNAFDINDLRCKEVENQYHSYLTNILMV